MWPEFYNAAFEMKQSIKASIVLCTYNRAEKLSLFLSKLKLLECSYPFEIILIDNNSTDKTPDILKHFVSQCEFPACYARETKKGTGYGRNTGASIARGEYLIYIDDDCYPDPDLVTQHIALLDKHPELGFVGGRVELYDSTDLPMTILTEKQSKRFSSETRIRAGEIISANMSIRKSAFESVKGWDNWFGAGTLFPCEDLDIAARILLAGWKGLYDPKPLVFHDHGRKTEQDAKELMASYDAGRGGFYAKSFTTPRMRKIYAWPWIKSLAKKDPLESLREIKSFVKYISLRITHK